jgi:hypothetical protein
MNYVAALSQDASERESESGFVLIRQVETTRPPSHYSALPHRHDFQEILVLQSGHVRYAIDGREPVEFCAPSVSFVAKGHIHIVEEAAGMTGWLVRFTSDFLPADLVSQTWNYEVTLFNQLGANQSLPLQPPDMHDLELMLELIESEYRRPATVVSVKWWKKANVISGHRSDPLIANLLVSSGSPQKSTRTEAL